MAVLDSATEMYSMTLARSARTRTARSRKIWRPPTNALMAIRPYIRYVDTQRMIGDLANGEICLAIGYNGDILQARDRADENKTGPGDQVRHSEGRHDHLVRQLSHPEGRAASEERAPVHQLHAAARSDRGRDEHGELRERQQGRHGSS